MGSPALSTACSSSTQNPTLGAVPSCCSAKPSDSELPRARSRLSRMLRGTTWYGCHGGVGRPPRNRRSVPGGGDVVVEVKDVAGVVGVLDRGQARTLGLGVGAAYT